MRRIALRLLALLAVACAVALAVLWLVPSNQYLLLPDTARPVAPLVHIAGERPDSAGGGIYMVDVSIRRASLLERFFPGIDKGSTLVPASALGPPGQTDAQRQQQGLAEMSDSQKIAAAVALRSLGRKVRATPTGAEVVLAFPHMPAAGRLEPGDVIVAARGHPVRSPDDLRAVMRGQVPGKPVAVTVARSGRRLTLTLPTVPDANDPKRAVVGVEVQQGASITLPVKIRIETGDIGGPSAGLAFALDIVDELDRDLDNGDRIAATGELDLAGRVLEIGGIKQKTIGAEEAGASIFLVPKANAAEARRYAKNIRVVAVSTFRQALSTLASR